MRVLVVSRNVDLGKVTLTSNLDVVGGLDKVNTAESSLGHDASTVAFLGTVSDDMSFDFTDGSRLRGGPQAEIIRRANRKMSIDSKTYKRASTYLIQAVWQTASVSSSVPQLLTPLWPSSEV